MSKRLLLVIALLLTTVNPVQPLVVQAQSECLTESCVEIPAIFSKEVGHEDEAAFCWFDDVTTKPDPMPWIYQGKVWSMDIARTGFGSFAKKDSKPGVKRFNLSWRFCSGEPGCPKKSPVSGIPTVYGGESHNAVQGTFTRCVDNDS